MPPKKRALRALGEKEVPQRVPKRAKKNTVAGKENEHEHAAVDESWDDPVPVTENQTDVMQNEQPRENLKIGVDLYDPEHPNALTEYICISAPEEDDHDQEQEDNEDVVREDKVQKDGKALDLSLQPADEHPDHKFITTRATNTLVDKYRVEVLKRDQDAFGCYFYNDFTGYGQQEVIENMLQAAYNEFASKSFDLHRFWVHIEALAMFFYTMRWELCWFGIDDSMRVSSTLAMIGVVVLTALNKLEAADLLKQGSSIRNIPLILSMYLMIADQYKEGMNSWWSDQIEIKDWTRWPNRIVAYANQHNIELSDKTGIKNTDKLVQKFGGAICGKFPPKRKSGKDRWGYKRAHKDFTDEYGHRKTFFGRQMVVGGDAFDITQMTKEHRIEKSYLGDGKDPLDEMEGPPLKGIWKF